MATTHTPFLTHRLYSHTLTPWQAAFLLPCTLKIYFISSFLLFLTISSRSCCEPAHYLPLLPFPCISPSPDPLGKLVSPPECQRLDGEAPIPSTSQVQRHPVNLFTGWAGIKFHGARNHTHIIHEHTHTYSPALTLLSSYFLATSLPFPPLTVLLEHLFLALSFPPSP